MNAKNELLKFPEICPICGYEKGEHDSFCVRESKPIIPGIPITDIDKSRLTELLKDIKSHSQVNDGYHPRKESIDDHNKKWDEVFKLLESL